MNIYEFNATPIYVRSILHTSLITEAAAGAALEAPLEDVSPRISFQTHTLSFTHRNSRQVTGAVTMVVILVAEAPQTKTSV